MADESVVQTVQRNLTPEQDSSRSALGPGHQFDSGDSPQQQGEAEYKAKLGTPLEQAYGKAKAWLSEHEQHLSEETLKPFRQGLDKMADDLEEAGSTGHTKSGGAMNPATRALASGTGQLLRAVPVGKDVKSTVQASMMPPSIGLEEREALTAEQELALSKLEGHKIVEAPPEFAYRARPVGQKNVSAGERPVATSSLEKANTYKENLESMTGQPHEVVHIPLKGTNHTVHSGPNEGEKWYSFKKDVPEENVKAPKSKEGGSGKPPEPPKEKFASPHPEYETSPPGSPAHKQINEWADRAGRGDEVAIQSLKKIAAQKIDAQDAKFAQQKLDALTSPPKKIIEDAGLKYKGELSKGSGVHMFEHPDHPGKTAALNEDQINPKNVKEKMASKLKEFGVKPTKFGDSDVVKKTDAAKGLKEPRNESKIVIEGVDDKKPEGKYSDRIKIDPFSPSYKPPATNKKQVTTT